MQSAMTVYEIRVPTKQSKPHRMKQLADERAVRPNIGQFSDAPTQQHLLASLALGFARDGNTTRLIQREHYGPLRVQKSLYPEDPSICHAILIHPPGGVVGGDELRITAQAGNQAHALLSTPGAAKWYRANGHVSHQQLQLSVANDAALEWLPQETIFFNGADVLLDSQVDLVGSARYLGCEILCFGRTASGEHFDQGQIRQQLSIRRDGKPLWREQGSLYGGSRQMKSPLGLAGCSVCASLIAVGPVQGPPLLHALRQQMLTASQSSGRIGATQIKSVIIARYLGYSSELARQVMLAAWQLLRPALLGHEASVPRIWKT